MAAMSANPMADSDVELSKHSVFEGAQVECLTWQFGGPLNLGRSRMVPMVPNEDVVTLSWKTREFLASYI